MRAYLILLLVCLVSIVYGQELIPVVEPTARVTKNVMLVIDVSGSVKNTGRIPNSLAQLREIANQPVDSMELAVLAFTEEQHRWKGIPEPENNIAEGWAGLPSENAIKEAQDWLVGVDTGTSTRFTPALETALREPRADLTIFVITDGIAQYAGEPDTTIAAVAGLQEWRVQQGYGKAVIYAIQFGRQQDWLGKLVTLGGGGFYHLKEDVIPKTYGK